MPAPSNTTAANAIDLGTLPALTQAELDGLSDAMDAQYEGTRPTLVVRRTSINDAMCGFIRQLSENPGEAPGRIEVSMTFEELPRKRWP